ncbi:alanine racemase [Leucobacter sp. HNU]|uniref:alanine racemase n=1 Tax=Leucobacter sp. HNU TaxID=3236805 RepID=UPI003A810CB6
MAFDLGAATLRARAAEQTWHADRERYWGSLSAATRDRPAPVVALSAEALSWNAHDLLRRAGGLPIRVASKSIRVRSVLESVLALPGYRGILAYTLDEAIWLAETGVSDDVVVAYPTANRAAIRQLAASERAAAAVSVMIDSAEQLDLIDAAVPPAERAAPIRVCLDFDASWRTRALGHIGVLRSPVHEPAELRALAELVLRRDGFALVGVMSYEAQIAGVTDDPPGRPVNGALMRAVQRASGAELVERRARAIAAVRAVADLEFVNGGGTGSIERTVSEGAVTEVAAGSGLFGPRLFDGYRSFTPAPAAAFALDVVRKPSPDTATLLGGGWIASGVAGADRSPTPAWPDGLRFAPREGAGEVQTPVLGRAAAGLRVGDRVWLRHTKSGEIMEHANAAVLVREGAVVDELPTYRGEGRCFL